MAIFERNPNDMTAQNNLNVTTIQRNPTTKTARGTNPRPRKRSHWIEHINEVNKTQVLHALTTLHVLYQILREWEKTAEPINYSCIIWWHLVIRHLWVRSSCEPHGFMSHDLINWAQDGKRMMREQSYHVSGEVTVKDRRLSYNDWHPFALCFTSSANVVRCGNLECSSFDMFGIPLVVWQKPSVHPPTLCTHQGEPLSKG